jgi:hypothetical protein
LIAIAIKSSNECFLVVCPSEGKDIAKKPMAEIDRANKRIIFLFKPASDRFDCIFFIFLI